MGKRRSRKGRDNFIICGVFVAILAAIGILFPESRSVHNAACALGSFALGLLLHRFGEHSRVFYSIGIGISILLWIVLSTYPRTDLWRSAAWLVGLVAGTNLGQGWRIRNKRNHRSTRDEWTVNGKTFPTPKAAGDSAYSILNSLSGSDPKSKITSVTVGHGTAYFEAAGDAKTGLVCHCTPDVADQHNWAVLIGESKSSEDQTEVPLGSWMGSVPASMVTDLARARTALEAFLLGRIPGGEGLSWRRGQEAADTRLPAG